MNHPSPKASIDALPGFHTITSSVTEQDGIQYSLVDHDDERRLALLAPANDSALIAFEGERHTLGAHTLLSGPLNARNAAALRNVLAWLQPSTLGLRTSSGLG